MARRYHKCLSENSTFVPPADLSALQFPSSPLRSPFPFGVFASATTPNLLATLRAYGIPVLAQSKYRGMQFSLRNFPQARLLEPNRARAPEFASQNHENALRTWLSALGPTCLQGQLTLPIHRSPTCLPSRWAYPIIGLVPNPRCGKSQWRENA
jgi:hypothetical protein